MGLHAGQVEAGEAVLVRFRALVLPASVASDCECSRDGRMDGVDRVGMTNSESIQGVGFGQVESGTVMACCPASRMGRTRAGSRPSPDMRQRPSPRRTR